MTIFRNLFARTEERAEAEATAASEKLAAGVESYADRVAARELERNAIKAAHEAKLEELRLARSVADETKREAEASLDARATAEDRAIEEALIAETDMALDVHVAALFQEPTRAEARAFLETYQRLNARWKHDLGRGLSARRIIFAAARLVIAESPGAVNRFAAEDTWKARDIGRNGFVERAERLGRVLKHGSIPELLAEIATLEIAVRRFASSAAPTPDAVERWNRMIGVNAAREVEALDKAREAERRRALREHAQAEHAKRVADPEYVRRHTYRTRPAKNGRELLDDLANDPGFKAALANDSNANA